MVKTKQAASSQPKPKKLYKGVRKQKGKWVSEITLPRRLAMMSSKVWLGSFNTFEEAALAYDTAAYVLRGNSASLNFPNLAHHAASAAEEFDDSCFVKNKSKGVSLSQGVEKVQEDEMLKSSSHACTRMHGEDGPRMHESQSISGGLISSENKEISEKLKYENECLKKEVEVLKEKVELERAEKMNLQKECSKTRVTYSLRVCALRRNIDFWKEKFVLMGGKFEDDFGEKLPSQEDGHEMGHPSNGKVAKKAARRSTEIRDDNDDCASGVALNGHKMTAKKPSGAAVLNGYKSSASKTKRALHSTVTSDKNRTMKRKGKLESRMLKQTIKSIPEAGNANASNFKRKWELQKMKQAKKPIREPGNANEINCSNTFQRASAFDTSSIPFKPVTLRPCEERMSRQLSSQYHSSKNVVDGFDLYGSEDSSNYSDSEDDSQKYNSSNKYESKGRDDKTWEHEVQMLLTFQEDTELCMKAVCALYRQHISLGKSLDESNSRGFSKLYANRGILLAKFLTHGNPQYKLNKSVDELHNLHAFDYNGLDECRRIAGHHVSQLFEIYKNNEDPFFP